MIEKRSQAALKYRDGQFILLAVFAEEARHLERAGFRARPLQLHRDDGIIVEGYLWIQDEPTLADFLHAGHLLFDDEPGSLTW